MKGLVYVVALLLSLPNMLAGTASIIIRHTFATFNPLQIIIDFLFQMVWGMPLAGALFLLLLVLGFFARTRPYAALFTFILNATALGFVLSRFGLPHDFPSRGKSIGKTFARSCGPARLMPAETNLFAHSSCVMVVMMPLQE